MNEIQKDMLSKLSTTNLSDALDYYKLAGAVHGIVPSWYGCKKIFGEAVTMRMIAAGITPQGPYKNGPGEINVPISCGGQVVFPGDILVGDADGVCVIRASEAKKIVEMTHKKFDGEQVLLEKYHTSGNDTENHQRTYTAITDKLGTSIY